MGKILQGQALTYGNAGQLIWVRTPSGDFPCLAQTEINATEVTVIVEDSGQPHVFCNASPNVAIARVVRKERTRPRIPEEELACKIINLAFVYKIQRADFSQDFYLVDFEGDHHFLVKVPKAYALYCQWW